MSNNNVSDGSGSRDREELKSLLFLGAFMFYIVNLAGFLIGLEGIETLGNLEGIVVMLVSIFGLNIFAGFAALKWSENLLSGL